MMKNIQTTIDNIQIGDTIQFKNLSIVPLFYIKESMQNYISLKNGLDKQLIEITEISENGSIPKLKVINNADVPLFILDGEELIGAKHNRIVNTSHLLASKSEFLVPVSCTERGRWNYNSKKFGDSGIVMSSKARSSKNNRIHTNLMSRKGYNAEQIKVWNDIEILHAKSGSFDSSRTRAMKDAFEEKKKNIDDWKTAFPLLENQNGMLVFENGKLVGGDFISQTTVYADLHEKLIKSYAIEAIGEKIEIPVNPIDMKIDAHLNLMMLKEAQATKHQPVGLGKDLRLEANDAKAAALQYLEEIIHLSIYSEVDIEQDDEKETPNLVSPSPLQRPNRRQWNLSNILKISQKV